MAGMIPQAAIDAVRAYTEGNMDGTVAVLRGTPGVLDEATGEVSGLVNSATIYSGKARVHTVSGQGTISLGPGQIDQRTTTISIPWLSTMPQRDDLVVIGSAGQDSDLNGVAFRVVQVEGGSAFGDARRMQCVMWGKSSYWDGVA